MMSELKKEVVRTKKKYSSVHLWGAMTNMQLFVGWLWFGSNWFLLKIKENSIFSNVAQQQVRATWPSWNRALTKKRCNRETNECHMTRPKQPLHYMAFNPQRHTVKKRTICNLLASPKRKGRGRGFIEITPCASLISYWSWLSDSCRSNLWIGGKWIWTWDNFTSILHFRSCSFLLI